MLISSYKKISGPHRKQFCSGILLPIATKYTNISPLIFRNKAEHTKMPNKKPIKRGKNVKE